MNAEYSDDQTVGEAIEETQNEIVEELTKKNSDLEQEVERLTQELLEEAEKNKKSKIQSSLDKMKEEGRNNVEEGKANVNIVDKNGYTFLHYTAIG